MESGIQSRGRGSRRPNGRNGPSTYIGRSGRIMPFRGRGRPFRSRAGGRGRGFPGRRARPPYHHGSSHDRRSPYRDRRESYRHGSLERRHYDRSKRSRSRSRSWSRHSRSRSRSRSRRRSTSRPRSRTRSRSRARSRSRSRGRSRTRSRSRSNSRSRYQSPVKTSGSAMSVKPVSVLDRLGPQHLPTEKATDPSIVQSIRITVGNDHYVQQQGTAENPGGQAPSGGPPGGASADGRGDNVNSKGSYPDKDRRWSSDQDRDRARYYESRPGERYPHYRPPPRSGERRSRSPERYPRDYGTSRDQRSYSQERRSADRDRRDYHSQSYYRQSPEHRAYRRSPSRSPGRRDYRRSPGQTPDRKDYRRSQSRSPGRRDYRRSPGRRSTSRSPNRDRYRRSGSRSPSTSRSSYSTNDPRRDHDPGARNKELHVGNPIFRDTPEFRGTDGIPETPPVRSILKNKADYNSIETPSPFRSESSLHGDVPVTAKTTQSHFGLPGIGNLDEIEDEDEFLYGGGGDSIKPATREPTVSGEPQREMFDYGHKPQRPETNSFPSSLVPDYDEDAGALDEHPPPQQPNSNAGPSTMNPPKPPAKTETAKKEPYDPTIENILKAIGFNFELSKLMQEKAKKEREKQEKKDTLGAYSINQTSSFLGSGLKNIDIGSVFDQKAAEKEQPPQVEKKEPEKTQLSYAELGRKYREEQIRAYQQGRSSPPPFHEKQRVERSRRKSDSLSPPRREQSRQRSESLSPPPLRRRRRSPSFEHGSPRSIKRSRSSKDSDPGLRSPPHSMDRLPSSTQDKSTPATVSQPYSVPPPYYGTPGWDPNMPYGHFGTAYPGQYYPPPGQYPMEWPQHYHPNYPPPSMHPDMPGDSQFYPKPPISSNLKVIPVIDDIADEKSTRKDSDSSVVSPSQKPSSRTVLPPRSESERHIDVRGRDDIKMEPHRRYDPKMSPRTEDRRRDDDGSTSLRRDSSSSSRPTLSQDTRTSSRQTMSHNSASSSKPTLSQEARERLMAEMQQRRRRLITLEKELDTLRRQQNELMRKKQRQRDGHKDPLLAENSMLQEEIAQQISALRRAADQNSSTLEAAGISDIETDDSKQFSDDKSSQRRMEKSPSLKTEKPAEIPKDEPNVNYEYFDPGNHWCRVCNHISTNIFDVFSHLHSKKHQQSVDRYDRPWVPVSLDLKNRLKKPIKSQIVVAPIKGVEFMMATQAFYCSICGTFSGDGACAEHHLKSKQHNDAYIEYCHDNPFYERHFDLDRAAGLSVMKFEGSSNRELGKLEDALGIDRSKLPLSKDQMTVELVRRRVQAVERKIRLDKPTDDRKSRFLHDSHFGGDISSTPPPTHYPRPKDKFLAKAAAVAAKEHRDRQGISIKLSGKQQVKFPTKNPLTSSAAPVKKLEPSLFRPVMKRAERSAPKPMPKPQKEAIFPLRKANEEKQSEETDDYMSSVDMFVTSSNRTRKKKPVPAVKGKMKALSQLDIAKAFSGHEEAEASASKLDTVRDGQVAAPLVVAPGSIQPATKVGPNVEPDSEAVAVSVSDMPAAVASTLATQPAADSVVPSQQDNEDAKSEGSGISMGSDFEILDELNAG